MISAKKTKKHGDARRWRPKHVRYDISKVRYLEISKHSISLSADSHGVGPTPTHGVLANGNASGGITMATFRGRPDRNGCT